MMNLRIRFSSRAVCLIAVVLALYPFFPVLFFSPLVEWDDGKFVFTNPHIALTAENLRFYLTGKWETTFNTIFLMLEHAVFGPNAFWFHFVSLLLYGGCVFFFFQILRKLHLSPLWAALFTLLWAWSPCRAETVAWISETKGLLSGILALAAVYMFMKRKILPSAFLTGAAILFKISSLPFPGVLFLISFQRNRYDLKKSLKETFPVLAAGGICAAGMILRTIPFVPHTGRHISLVNRVILFFCYVADALYPVTFNPLHPYWMTKELISGCLIGFALVLLLLFFFRRNRLSMMKAGIGLLAVAFITVPIVTSGRFTNAIYANRYSFLVTAAFLAVWGIALAPLMRLKKTKKILFAVIAAITLLNVFGLYRSGGLYTFANSASLFLCAAKYPTPAPAAINGLSLTSINLKRGDMMMYASSLFRDNRTIFPPADPYRKIYCDMALLLEKMAPALNGGLKEKLALARYMERKNSFHVFSEEHHLAKAFGLSIEARLQTGSTANAVLLLKKVQQVRGLHPFLRHFYCGMEAYLTKKYEKAAKEWKMALKYHPDDFQVQNNLNAVEMLIRRSRRQHYPLRMFRSIPPPPKPER